MQLTKKTVTSKWAGKIWNVVGDSITEHNTKTTYNYHDYIAQKIGCTVNNYGISGTGWRCPSSVGGTNAIYQRLNSLATNADLITVFAGTNDWAQNGGTAMVLGSLGDTSASTSFYGAVDQILSTLVNTYPTKTVAVFTPLQRASAWYNLSNTVPTSVWAASTNYNVAGSFVTPKTANGYCYVSTNAGTSGATEPVWPTTLGSTVSDGTITWKFFGAPNSNTSLQDISNAIIAVANKYNVPVLDLYKNGNMYAQNTTFQTNTMPDGLHPNDNGHQMLADKILAFLNTL